jgi:hypothetical protein
VKYAPECAPRRLYTYIEMRICVRDKASRPRRCAFSLKLFGRALRRGCLNGFKDFAGMCKGPLATQILRPGVMRIATAEICAHEFFIGQIRVRRRLQFIWPLVVLCSENFSLFHVFDAVGSRRASGEFTSWSLFFLNNDSIGYKHWYKRVKPVEKMFT